MEKYLSFRMRDVELGHIVKGRHTTIATHLQHFLSFIGKDTKLKELERTDCENYFYHRHKATNGNVKQEPQQQMTPKDTERTDFTPIRPQPPLQNQQDDRDIR